MAVVVPSFLASLIGIFLRKGTGYHMTIPVMLKNRWHIEICSEGFSVLESCANELSIEVTVVPILDPSVSGYILSTVRTPMPTSGVRAEVNILEDCTSIVRIAPIKIAR